METLYTTLILASSHLGAGQGGVDAFWNSGAGKTLGAVFGVAGLFVVITGVIKAIKHVLEGKIGQAVKVALGAAFIAAFLFQPSLLSSLLDTMGDLAGKVVDSVNDVTGSAPGSSGGGGAGNSTPPPGTP